MQRIKTVVGRVVKRTGPRDASVAPAQAVTKAETPAPKGADGIGGTGLRILDEFPTSRWLEQSKRE